MIIMSHSRWLVFLFQVSKDGDPYGRNSVELSGTKGSISDAKRLIQAAGVVIKGEDDYGRGW